MRPQFDVVGQFSLSHPTHSSSNRVEALTAIVEPTRETETFVSIPFTRYLPDEDTFVVNTVEMVRHRLTTDSRE